MIRLITHIVLSGLILLSVTGLTINFHYCQDSLYDIALNSPAESCYENGAHENCCHPDSDMETNHCDDETLKVESTDDFFVSSFSFDFEDIHQIDLLFAFHILLENQRTSNTYESEVLNFKKPPILHEVELSQIQTYLI